MNPKEMWQALTDIIDRIDSMETLDTRNSDEQDFHELPVWLIKEMMEAAYTAGFNTAKKEQ